MKIKAERKYQSPKYPERFVYENNPEMLLRYVPAKWLKSSIVASALTAFVFGGNCSAENIDTPDDTVVVTPRKPVKEQFTMEINENINCKIAPIFIHGDGRGSTGCIVMTPPCFISESDAKEIILKKLENAGIKFESRDYLFKENYNSTKRHLYFVDYKKDIEITEEHDFVFDGYRDDINLGIKYITHTNVEVLNKKSIENTSSVQSYNLIGDAQQIKEDLGKDCEANIALFYDPIIQEAIPMEEARKQSRKLLEEQVEDFIMWVQREFPEVLEDK